MSRDVALTKYIRWRLLNWRDDEGNLKTPKQIQQETGASPSAISQIRSGKLGVGPAVLAPLATAWNMTQGQLMDTAREWWSTHGSNAAETVAHAKRDPELSKAVDLVKSLHQLNDEQIEAIVAGYGSDYFRGREMWWWVNTLLAEAQRMRNPLQLAIEREQKRGRAKWRKKKREHEVTKQAKRIVQSIEAGSPANTPRDTEHRKKPA